MASTGMRSLCPASSRARRAGRRASREEGAWAVLRYPRTKEQRPRGRAWPRWINLGEVPTSRGSVARSRHPTVRDLREVMEARLPDERVILDAARIKADQPMSYADAFAAALAVAQEAELWTGPGAPGGRRTVAVEGWPGDVDDGDVCLAARRQVWRSPTAACTASSSAVQSSGSSKGRTTNFEAPTSMKASMRAAHGVEADGHHLGRVEVGPSVGEQAAHAVGDARCGCRPPARPGAPGRSTGRTLPRSR